MSLPSELKPAWKTSFCCSHGCMHDTTRLIARQLGINNTCSYLFHFAKFCFFVLYQYWILKSILDHILDYFFQYDRIKSLFLLGV